MFQNKEEAKEVVNHLAEAAEDQEELMKPLPKQLNHNNDIKSTHRTIYINHAYSFLLLIILGQRAYL